MHAMAVRLGRVLGLACVLVCALPIPPVWAEEAPPLRLQSKRLAIDAAPERLRAEELADVRVLDIPLPAMSAAEVAAALGPGDSRPVRIGFGRALPGHVQAGDLARRLDWQRLPEGGRVAILIIKSPGAVAMRLGIEIGEIPPVAELRFFGEVGYGVEMVSGAVIAETIGRNLAAGDRGPDARTYWSPITEGASLGLEIFLPDGVADPDVDIRLSMTSHLVYSDRTGARTAEFKALSASCEVDVMCFPAYSTIKGAVARMAFTSGGSTSYCTGTLLNDAANSQTPYFWTANHCLSTQSVASTLVTRWSYESTDCNSGIASAYQPQRSGGALLLYTAAASSSSSPGSDITLLRLLEPSPIGTFSGWNTVRPASGTAVFGIHHPRTDLKKFTRGSVLGYWVCDPIPNSNQFQCAGNANGSFVRIAYTEGITESGSSGSGIFLDNSGQQLFAQLYGGNSTCADPSSGFYGLFGSAYSAGGLATWLNQTSAPFRLTVLKHVLGGGSVTSTDGTINCGATCVGSYAANSTVTLNAVAGPGYLFTGWSGSAGCSGVGPCVVTMSKAHSVSASFSPASIFPVANGQIKSTLGGIAGSYRYYFVDVPLGASNLEIKTFGGTGNLNLYVRYGTQPDIWNYGAWDCAGFNADNVETCVFPQPQPGLYYITLYGQAIYDQAKLQVTYSTVQTSFAAGQAAVDSNSNSAPTVITSLPVTCPASGSVLVAASGESAAQSSAAGLAFVGLAYSIARDSTLTDNANVVQSSALATFAGDTNRDFLNLHRVDTCTPGAVNVYQLTAYRTTPDTSASSFLWNARLTAAEPKSLPASGFAPATTAIASTSNASPTVVSTLTQTCPASGRLLLMGSGEAAAVSAVGGTAFIGLGMSISRDSVATDNGNVVQSSALSRFNGDANRDFINVHRADTCTPGASLTYRLTAYRTTPATGPGSFVWNGRLVAVEPLNPASAGYAPATTPVASSSNAAPTVVASVNVTCPASGAVLVSGSGESAAQSTSALPAFVGLAFSVARGSVSTDNSNVVQSSALAGFDGDVNRDFVSVQRVDACVPGAGIAYALTAYRTTPETGSASFVWNGRLSAVAVPAAQ